MIKLGYLVDGTDWKVNEPGFKKLTHLHYAFAVVGDQLGKVIEKFQRADQIRLLKANNPHIKVCLSIGGWGADHFSEAAATNESRKNFSKTAIEIMVKYGFDGLDIDWEYPCVPGGGISASPDDKKNFTLMLKQCREDLNKLNPKYLLTIAVSGSMSDGKNTELTEIIKYLDFLNVMTYDMENWGYASHHTNLFTTSKVPNQFGGATYIERYLQNGVPSEKLAFGIAFYGRGGRVVSDQDGLMAVLSNPNRMAFSYTKIRNELLTDRSYQKYWDEEAKTHYIFNGDIFVSYDDPQSVEAKVNYVKEHHLAGVFFWQFKGDETGELVNAIDKCSK
ncbi:MAG: chitinase [Haloplasmataceae bacterium]|nr:chitinase [Haloplasmataceae bacterium]